MDHFDNLLVETHDRVGVIRLNRPSALNALSSALMQELGRALRHFDQDAAGEQHQSQRCEESRQIHRPQRSGVGTCRSCIKGTIPMIDRNLHP